MNKVAVTEHPTVDASYIQEQIRRLQEEYKQYHEQCIRLEGAITVLDQLYRNAQNEAVMKAKAKMIAEMKENAETKEDVPVQNEVLTKPAINNAEGVLAPKKAK